MLNIFMFLLRTLWILLVSCDLVNTTLSSKVDDCTLHLSLVQSCLLHWRACMFVRRSLERPWVVFMLSWLSLSAFFNFSSCIFSVLSCRSPSFGTQSCGIRVRPGAHHVPHGNCGPWKHLLARRGYVELVPVVCILNRTVWEQFFLGQTRYQNNFWNRSPSGTIVKTLRKRPVSPL